MEYMIYIGKSRTPKDYKYFGKTPNVIQKSHIIETERQNGNNVLVLTHYSNGAIHASHYYAYINQKAKKEMKNASF